MAGRKILKYVRLYALSMKYGAMVAMEYRMTFLFAIFVDTGYNLGLIFFYHIIYGNIRGIAGWSYHEMLFLIGLNIIAGEMIINGYLVERLFDLPRKIKEGEIDLVILRPVHSLFALSLKGLTFGIINMIPGFYLLFISLRNLHYIPQVLDIISSFIIFSQGMIICYALTVIITSLAFRFNSSSEMLPRTAGEAVFQFSEKPHDIYHPNWMKRFFTYVFPAIFLSSIPAKTILHGVDTKYLFLSIFLGIIFLTLAIKFWNRMIRYYSSASS